HVRMWINAPLYSTRWARPSFAALLRTHGHRAITPYCSRTRMASDWRSISFRVRVCSRREHSFALAQRTWVEAEAACSPRLEQAALADRDDGKNRLGVVEV